MSPLWKVTAFVAQSVAVGLAIAFVVVLVRPELVNRSETREPTHDLAGTVRGGYTAPRRKSRA